MVEDRATVQPAVQVTATVPVGAVPEATNPNEVDWPAATAPFQAAFFTVNAEPELDSVPDHRFETAADIVNDVDQDAIAAEPALTVTPAWKPPCQLLATENVAVHDLAPVASG